MRSNGEFQNLSDGLSDATSLTVHRAVHQSKTFMTKLAASDSPSDQFKGFLQSYSGRIDSCFCDYFTLYVIDTPYTLRKLLAGS